MPPCSTRGKRGRKDRDAPRPDAPEGHRAHDLASAPRGSYFSELALLGPRNFYNLHPFLTVNLTDRLAITADVEFFWRLQTEDGIYSPGGQLLRSGAGSDARYVGTEASLNTSWQANEWVDLTGIYAHFFPGEFIQDTGPAKDIDHVEFTLKIRF